MITIENDDEAQNIENDLEFIIKGLKYKQFNIQFDSLIFGYLLGFLLQNKKENLKIELIEKIFLEFQRLNESKSKINIVYTNLKNYITYFENNKTNLSLNLNKEDSDDFSLLKDSDDNFNNFNNINCDNNINNNNYINNNINSINFVEIENKINDINLNNCLNIDNNNNNKKKDINEYKNINSIICPEDYEDYKEDEKNVKGKCLICLEEYEYASDSNYYLDCDCIVHGPCFDDYIINAINSGKVPIKCPYCNKKDINEAYVKDSLIQNKKEELIDKFDNFNMNYYIMQHPDDISCCPTPGCKYVFLYQEGDDQFECPMCDKEYCLKCKSDWHEGLSCQEYRKQLQLAKNEKKLDDLFYDFVKGSKFKQCPYCKHWVEKIEGCNHIACKCGNHFCYNCGEKINDIMYGHECFAFSNNNNINNNNINNINRSWDVRKEEKKRKKKNNYKDYVNKRKQRKRKK